MKAVVIRADKNIKGYTEYTMPIIKRFCEKWDATLEILDGDTPVMSDDNRPHYRIIDVNGLLDKYDRVMCLDADMVILPHCPNPFDEVPEDKIGSIFEDKGSRRPARHQLIKEIQNVWGDIGWKEGYTNAGIFIVSKMHQPIFNSFEGNYWTGWGSADLHLSYMARRYGFQFHELDFKWNHMTMFSEAWNNNADRFDSYIIHYAGNGVFDAGNRNQQIQSDIETVYK